MGVNHLRRDASSVQTGKFRGNVHKSPQSQQATDGPNFRRPAETSGTRQVPNVSAVVSFDSKSVHPGNVTPQPPKGNENGGRGGAKSGQEHTGMESGNKKMMSGSAAGGPVGK